MSMQPYQEASEEVNRQSAAPINALKKGVGFGAGAALLGGPGSAILSRILPFLNKHIAPSMAIKGITKIHGGLGKAINAGLQMGYSFADISDFLRKDIEGEEEQQQPGELSREGLQQQFTQGYPQAAQQMQQQAQQGMAPQGQGQGKGALAPIMAEAIQILRSLKQGG